MAEVYETYELTRAQIRRIMDWESKEGDEHEDDGKLLELLDAIQGDAGYGPVVINVPKAEV